MRILNAIMAVIFVFAAIVQYNDPDALYWGLLYLSAALVCGLAATGDARYRSWVLPAVVGLAAAIWAAVLAPEVLGQVHFAQLFEAWEMDSAAIEGGREVGGLAIVAGWMALLVVVALRQRTSARLAS